MHSKRARIREVDVSSERPSRNMSNLDYATCTLLHGFTMFGWFPIHAVGVNWSKGMQLCWSLECTTILKIGARTCKIQVAYMVTACIPSVVYALKQGRNIVDLDFIVRSMRC